jgi:GNAT superfamily N-acetyltransferase
MSAYFSELAQRFESGFDPDKSLPATNDDLSPPNGLLLVAWLDDGPVGCAAVKFHSRWAEVKRMWVAESVRGRGRGRRPLEQVEHHARAHGARTLRLKTNRSLVEAIRLYRSSGYREVDAFNAEPFAHHWFEKDIASGPSV